MWQKARERPAGIGPARSETVDTMPSDAVPGDGDVAGPPAPPRCQAIHRASATARPLRCSRTAIARVTGTQRLTIDVCAQHARMAADRPRLVREWVLGRADRDDPAGGPVAAPAPSAAPSSEATADVVLTTAAEPAALTLIRAGVSRALVRSGWSPELREGVLLAVGEAAANAVEHGSSPGARVCVVLHADADRIRVSVTDSGRLGSVVPLVVPLSPPATDLRGRGLVLMRRLSQSLRIQSGGEGTVVTMEFTPAAARRPPAG